MPLYVSRVGSFGDVVVKDLPIIVFPDSFSTQPGPDDTVARVEYSPQSVTFVHIRLGQLANLLANAVVIMGVDASFVLSDGTPITSVGGVAGRDALGVVRVIYDVTGCNKKGYYAYDFSGNQIDNPSPVMLFHELAHAFHLSIGDAPPPGPTAESQAITDENQLRALLGGPLRDPNNPGGGCRGGGGGPICYIASAAEGSPYAPEVNRLRCSRDMFARNSRIGLTFFDRFFDEYYRFSPHIARDMQQSPSLLFWIRWLLVRPLIEFFALLEQRIAGGWREAGFADIAIASMQRFQKECTIHAWIIDDVGQLVCARLRSIHTLLASENRSGPSSLCAPPKDIDPVEVFNYLIRVVSTLAQPNSHCVAWATVEPIELYWTVICDFMRSADLEGAVRSLTERMDAWLGSAPMLPLPHAFDETMLRDDLLKLSASVFTPPTARRRYGSRLLEMFGEDFRGDLRGVLLDTDFLQERSVV